MGARRSDAAGERLPPFVEGRVLDVDRQRCPLDRSQAGCLEQLGQVPLAHPGEVRFVVDAGVELARGLPEDPQRALAPAVVPDAGRHDAVASSHSPHLGQAGDGIRHEVDDQLREGGFEGPICERELLSRRLEHGDTRVPLAGSANERF